MSEPDTGRDQEETVETQPHRGPRPSFTPREFLASQHTEVHPDIIAGREMREYRRVQYQKELVQRTNTWEGFEAHLLFLRGTLEEHGTTHMMQRWRMPQGEWPKIEAEDLWRQMGPHPERPYEADRGWVIKRFMQLQRWGHGRVTWNTLKWHELRDHLWLLDLQRGGEPFIKDILETKKF